MSESDHLPFEIQVEIIQRLPLKSLLQFRSVSKAWKSLIDSSKFIAGHSFRHPQPERLLIRYDDPFEAEEQYVSIVDDDSLALQDLTPTVPLLIKVLDDSRVVGSSHGLLCLYGYYGNRGHSRPNSGTEMAVLWNPSIRKSVPIVVPNVLYSPYETFLGFGVCPVTLDPKIVKIAQITIWELERITTIPWQVQVFTLSSGGWRSPFSNLPRKSIEFTWSQVAIDRLIYWVSYDRIVSEGGGWVYNLIMSFDLTSEEFREVELPVSLAHGPAIISLSITKLRESLAVIEYHISNEKQVCDIWMMDNGVPTSFTKLFAIRLPDASIQTLGFRKSGKAIIEMQYFYENDFGPAALSVYEPYSEHKIPLGIAGIIRSFFMSSYMETLLLLDQ